VRGHDLAATALHEEGLGEMKRRAISGIPGFRPACFAAAAALWAFASALPAQAQSVVVDLSVLGGGGGYSPSPYGATGPATVAGDGLLLFPPNNSPVSRLEGPLSGQTLAPAPREPMRAASPASAPLSRVTVAALTPPVSAKPASAPASAATLAPPPEPAQPAAAQEPATTPEPPAVSSPPPQPLPAKTLSAAAAPAAPPPTQTAAVQSGDATGDETRMLFDIGSAELNDAAKASLDALAERLSANENLRVRLQAFASGNDETAPEARRLSLKRALNVRGHLVERNIRNTRMDVRALGIKSGDGPADRVDAVILTR
jgi:outer membrane protein OmpA-like peptidoglycan-associated protein